MKKVFHDVVVQKKYLKKKIMIFLVLQNNNGASWCFKKKCVSWCGRKALWNFVTVLELTITTELGATLQFSPTCPKKIQQQHFNANIPCSQKKTTQISLHLSL